jgi:hypothetical protein
LKKKGNERTARLDAFNVALRRLARPFGEPFSHVLTPVVVVRRFDVGEEEKLNDEATFKSAPCHGDGEGSGTDLGICRGVGWVSFEGRKGRKAKETHRLEGSLAACPPSASF